SAESDWRFRIYDLHSRSLCWQSAAKQPVSGLRFSEDGSAFFACFTDKTVRKHDLRTGVETTLGTFEPTQRGGMFSPDGRLLAYVGATPRTIRILNLAKRAESQMEAPSDVLTMAWSKDGTL